MADTVKVRVKHGWTVYDGETQRTGGDVLTVSSDQAADWATAGWVETVTAAKTRRTSGVTEGRAARSADRTPTP